MPRTRQVKTIAEPKNEDMESFEQFKQVYLHQRQLLLKQKEEVLQNNRLLSKWDKLGISISIGNKTLKELRQKTNWQTFSSASHWSVLSSVGQPVDTGMQKKKTSDDGYLTSDSGTEPSGGTRSTRRTRSASTTALRKSLRASRSQSRNVALEKTALIKKSARKSRSMSRNSNHLQVNKFKTPMNTRKLDHFGMITPKIKPNTPSVVLRRPQQGEVAISLQGSPLMTTAMVSETTANVNIPLGDGRMINIQPMKGLRRSEIPELNPEIQKQLRTLRDNLDKVFQFASGK